VCMCGVPRSIYQWPSTSISLFRQPRQSARLDTMTTTIKEGASQLVCVLRYSLLKGIHWPKKLASQPRQCSFSRDTHVFSTAWRSFLRPLRAYELPNSLLNSFGLNGTHGQKWKGKKKLDWDADKDTKQSRRYRLKHRHKNWSLGTS